LQRWGSYVFADNFTGSTTNWSFNQRVDLGTVNYGDKFYQSWWMKFTGDPAGRNIKPWRCYSGGGIGTYPNIHLSSGVWGVNAPSVYVEDLPTTNTRFYGDHLDIMDGNWHHIEVQWQLSSGLGLADGNISLWTDNVLFGSSSAFQFNSASRTALIDYVLWQITLTSATNPNGRFLHSDLVLEDSWMRAVIGNASTYEACTHTENQPLTAHSATSVTFTLRPGTFASQSGTYLYLFDASGVMNTTGFAMSGLGGGSAAAPTYTSITPSSGTTLGSTAFTIVGTEFVATPTIRINSILATSVVRVNSTTLTGVTPAGTAGAQSLLITNPDSQSVTAAAAYTYYAPPDITNVNPSTGTSLGGQTVQISGTGFRAGAIVKIGGDDCLSVIVNSATLITVQTPSGTVGAQSVYVENTDAQNDTLASGYTYTAPATFSVASVSPSSGSTTGGTAVGISGTGFVPGATVSFGGALATNVVVVNPNFITCVTIARSSGTVTVTVTNPDTLTASKSSAFTFTEPVIPSSGEPTVISGAEPKIYTRNQLNSQTQFSVTSSTSSISSICDGDRVRKWVSTSQNSDLSAAIIEASFYLAGVPVSVEIDTIMLLNHNLKSFVVDYFDGTEYQLFATSSDVAASDSIVTASRVTTTKIRLTAYITQTANAEKYLGEMIACALDLDIGADPVSYEVQAREKVKLLNMGDGSIHEVRTKISANRTQKYQCRIKFDLVPLATLKKLESIKESGQPFLWQPESRWRPDQVYLVNWSTPLRSRYTSNYKGAGYEVDLDLREL
jgi:hypothetical protein